MMLTHWKVRLFGDEILKKQIHPDWEDSPFLERDEWALIVSVAKSALKVISV